MAVRGLTTVECDKPGCYAEVVLTTEDLWRAEGSVTKVVIDAGWHVDDITDRVTCPQCYEEANANR